MSDIKKEVALNEIKEAVEHLKNTGNFGLLLALSKDENGQNRVNQFFVNTIISLITTIESHEQEMKSLSKLNYDLNIVLLDYEKTIESQASEIASLKAITELKNTEIDFWKRHLEKYVPADVFERIIDMQARLQNAQT